MIIMKASNGVYSDVYTLWIIILQELENPIKNLQKKLYFKNIKFPVKVRNIHKIQKKLHRH